METMDNEYLTKNAKQGWSNKSKQNVHNWLWVPMNDRKRVSDENISPGKQNFRHYRFRYWSDIADNIPHQFRGQFVSIEIDS